MRPGAQPDWRFYWITDPKTCRDRVESKLREYNNSDCRTEIHEAMPATLHSSTPTKSAQVRLIECLRQYAYIEGWRYAQQMIPRKLSDRSGPGFTM